MGVQIIYLAGSSQNDDKPIDTELVLFCLKCCDLSDGKENGTFTVVFVDDESDTNSETETMPGRVIPCKPPCVVSADGCVHSGLTASIRQIIFGISSIHQEHLSLLGYHQNCLRACAEVSSWTHFVENLLPPCFERGAEISELPLEIRMLEKHLRSPVMLPTLKASEIKKLTNAQFIPKTDTCGDQLVEALGNLSIGGKKLRYFVDGATLTLIDLIVFPCVHKLFVSISHVSRLLRWQCFSNLCWSHGENIFHVADGISRYEWLLTSSGHRAGGLNLSLM